MAQETRTKRVARRAAPLPEQGEPARQAAPRGIADEPVDQSSDERPKENIFDQLESRRPERQTDPDPVVDNNTPQFEGDATLLTRRKNQGDGDARLDVPEKYRKPGYDYEWKTARVNGADVDQSEVAEVYENGWRPVLAASMPDMVTPGFVSKYISRLGQILYTRPMHLTEEANREQYDRAERQKFEKLRTASDIQMPKSTMKSLNRGIEIHGEAGTHKGFAKPAQ